MGAGAEAMAVDGAGDGSSGSFLGPRAEEPEGPSATEADATPTQLEGSAGAAVVALGGSSALGTFPAAATAPLTPPEAAATLWDTCSNTPSGEGNNNIPGTLRDEELSARQCGEATAGQAGWTFRGTGSQPCDTLPGGPEASRAPRDNRPYLKGERARARRAPK